MKRLRVYVIDDQLHEIKALRKFIDQIQTLEFAGAQTDARLALQQITSGEIQADIVLLDIDMPHLSGIELAQQIHTFAEIIFITAHDQYAVESYLVNALDYMLKPVSFERFQMSINKAEDKIAGKSGRFIERENYFFVSGDRKGKLVKIEKDDIVFIEAGKNHLIFNMMDGTRIITYLTISEFEMEVTYKDLVRVHRSFIVNLHKIVSKDNNILYLKNGTQITVGKTYRKELDDHLLRLSVISYRKNKRPGLP